MDVHADVALRVLALEEEELRDDEVRDLVIDRGAEEDDPLLEQERKDVEGALRAWAGLDDGGDHVVRRAGGRAGG